MATLSHSESRRLYSWWWDSHISPKNSKWLRENLTDIDTKVKSMIKLIEEEADSFARRAEMYYKKRPELMKLVEEFYRAYRALAERYDHAMGELRHAHKTMPEAFPNSTYYILADDDSPCGSASSVSDAESHASGPGMARPIFSSKRSSEVNSQNYSESDHSVTAESEVQKLREALAKIQSAKDALFLQYQKSLEKLSEMEKDLNTAQKDAGGLDERATKAEIEVKILKEALVQLKFEKDAGQVQYNQCLESIARLQTMLSLTQMEAKGSDERAAKAETEANNLKQELTRLESDKDAVLLQYKHCLEKIPALESKVTAAEENSRMLNEQIVREELEMKSLKKHFAELNEEKESFAVHYHQCLEKISKLENEILCAQENTEQLKREIDKGAEKLESSEKHRNMLEESNQHLQLEAEQLVQKIAMKDQALLEKHTEIKKLQTMMHEEHSHFLQIESALQTLQKLYSQSQQEQRNLALELKYGLQLMKDLELSKQGFQEEVREIADKNMTLHEVRFSSTRSLIEQQMEISKLKDIKEKLEQQFSLSAEESNVLQLVARQIKDDIQHLNERYQAMLEQLQSLGLNPRCFAASVKDLQNENSKLKESCKMDLREKETLREKLKDMDELLIENAFMGFSLLRLNDELDSLGALVKEIQDSCQVLQKEKSILVGENSNLLSHLQTITNSMKKLVEKNNLLEKSLSDAKIELEGVKAKSSDLEELCKSLNDEKCDLLSERSMLICQLEMVEAKLSNLENRFTELEEKYADVEKGKESTENQVEELRASILVQKQKHAIDKNSIAVQLANLENLVRIMQEEMQSGKIEYERELDRAVNAQIEMFILQNCIEELELKNVALLSECEKHVEASKFADKVIYELESENLKQLIEEEFLLHEIRKFKMGIRKVCEALQFDPDVRHDKGIKQEEIPVSHILDKIEGLKSSLLKSQEEKQQLLVENSILLTSLHQHQSEGEKLELDRKIMEQELESMREQNLMLQKDKVEIVEKSRQLSIEVANGEEREKISKYKLEALHAEMIDLQQTNQVFLEEHGKMLKEKKLLLKSILDLRDALSTAEDEKNVIFPEVLALSNQNLVYESFLTEKVIEQNAVSEHLGNLIHLNSDLNQALFVLTKKFEVKEAENVYLNKSTQGMDNELLEVKHQMEKSVNLLKKKEEELAEMEKRLKVAETLNGEYCRYIEELKREQEESTLIKENLDRQILELSENCMNDRKDIEHLNEANRSFQSEMRILLHNVEQQGVREETLNFELLDKSNEVKLWEAEASAFYFELQISSICGALLEGKVTELSGVCKRLDDESAAKSLVIEHMRERVNLLEGKLSAYSLVISSLKEDFASLERIFRLWTDKTSAVDKVSQKDVVIEACLQETESALIPDGVSDLLSLQTRIREVKEIMMRELERRIKKENLTANVEAGRQKPKIGNRKTVMELKEDSTLDQNALRRRTKPKIRLLMKDIPLDHNMDDLHFKYFKRDHRRTDDQMLELCETNVHDGISEAHKQRSAPVEDFTRCLSYSTELDIEKELGVDKLELSKSVKETREDDKRKILERLASDGKKLAILKMALEDLKKKPETKKKSKQGSDIEYETVKRHIDEVEEAVMQQAGIYDQLAKDVEESASSLDRENPMELEKCGYIQRRKVIEHARRGSEQIGRLQFEVQNIQYILLKLTEESNYKGKNRFSRPTGVLLRDFIQIGRKSSKRRRRGCVCGCSRPSTSED